MTSSTANALALASRLVDIAKQLGLPQVASDIEQDTERRLGEQTLRAIVVGELKHGKSTLINALCGSDALPMGVVPTTGSIVVVRAGAPTGPFRVLPSGKRIETTLDRFRELARSTENIERLELVVPEDALPAGFELVDSPGINDVHALRASIARGEMPRGDAIVMVLDATQLLGRVEQAFVQEAVHALGGLQEVGAVMLVAVTRIDLVAQGDRDKVRNYLREKLGPLGILDTDVFFVNAKAHVNGDVCECGFEALRTRLFALARERHDRLPQRAQAGLVRHGRVLLHAIAIAERASELELEGLKREAQSIRDTFARHRDDLGSTKAHIAQARDSLLRVSDDRLQSFRDELLVGVLASVEGASLTVLTNRVPGALHDAFVAFAHDETERLRVGLDDLTKRVLATHREDVRRQLAEAMLRLGFAGPAGYLDPPSLALEAGMIAVGLAGTLVMYFGNLFTGTIMTVAGPLTTVFLRERAVVAARVQAKVELPKAIDRTCDILRTHIREAADAYLQALEEHLELAGKRLGEQLAQVLEHVHENLQGATDDASARIALRSELAALRDELTALQQNSDRVSTTPTQPLRDGR